MNLRNRIGWAAVVVMMAGLASSAFAADGLELPAIFGDHMVLQADMAVPVWGQAKPGDKITVQVGAQQKSAVADAKGQWKVTLDPLTAGGPVQLTVSDGGKKIVFTDVLIGEVWLCSGQSNMEFRTRLSLNGDQEVANANNPKIRLFHEPKTYEENPSKTVNGKWEVCSSESVPEFAAVGYFFGRMIQKELGKPVGLIEAAWGGSSAEAWTRRETLERDPAFKSILDNTAKMKEEYPRVKEEHDKKVAAAAEARKAGGKRVVVRTPAALMQNKWACGLSNGMIAPLVPFAFKGVIWYQGEANVQRAYQYRKLFPTMIADWRDLFGRPDMPFLFVQLANLRPAKDEPADSPMAELREAQTMTLSVPHTAMATAVDIGQADNIHPKNKQEVGRRLALAALATVYGQKLVYSGPVYRDFKVEGDKVRVRFDHVGGGLVAKEGGELKGFALAGADKKFVWAEAKIDGDSVIVSAQAVKSPVAVRYGWADNPTITLYNKEGLPAIPFRTDDWPGVTAGKE